jgi:hypothetical protein
VTRAALIGTLAALWATAAVVVAGFITIPLAVCLLRSAL